MATTVVSLFNHKGGVGKTTITVNLARAFAQNGRRVLVVDGDPQCNSSAFYLPEEDLDKLLEESIEVDEGNTLWSTVSNSVRGKGEVRAAVPQKVDEAGVWLLPGDVALGPFEDKLVTAWRECFSRDASSIDRVSALERGMRATAESINADLILLDLGPSVGALNRILLLSSNYFVVPVACDLFSLRALRTVGESMSQWLADWKTISDLIAGLKGVHRLTGRPAFLGYLTQHFNIYRSRATAPFEEWERKIAPRTLRDVVDKLRPIGAVVSHSGGNKIGSIPAFHSLAPLSQKNGVPIGALLGIDDVNPGYTPKIKEADTIFRSIADNIQARIDSK